MDPIIIALAELGPLGLFAGFLAYQYHKQQKDQQAERERFQNQVRELQKEFQAQVSAMQEKAEATTDKVRDRYDKIILEKDQLYARLSGKLESDIDHIRNTADKLAASSTPSQGKS